MSGKSLGIIHDEDQARHRPEETQQPMQAFLGGGLRLQISAKDGLEEKAGPLHIVRRGGGKAEEQLHPVRGLAQTGSTDSGQLGGETRPQNLEIGLGPMGGDGAIVMKVEGLDRLLFQGDQSALPVLAGHFAGGHQGLEPQGENFARQEVEFGEGGGIRQHLAEGLQDVLEDMGGIGGAPAHQIDAHEMVALRKLLGDPLQQTGLSETGPGSPKQDDATFPPLPELQKALQLFERLVIDLTDNVLGPPAKDFKPGAEWVSCIHDEAEK